MIAITREVGDSLGECALTHIERERIDLDLARTQHATYRQALAELGCTVIALPPEHHLPDSCFVEDAALVLDEVAVILRPRLAERRQELETVARGLAAHRPLRHFGKGGFVEGGDILRVGRTLYGGRSTRTDEAGIEALAPIVEPQGYRIVPVEVRGCLHLKTGCTSPLPGIILYNPEWIDAGAFAAHTTIEVHPEEPWAANTLTIGGVCLHGSGQHRTAERLARAGVNVRTIDLSEFSKAEAGLTCLSLMIPPR